MSNRLREQEWKLGDQPGGALHGPGLRGSRDGENVFFQKCFFRAIHLLLDWMGECEKRKQE